MVFTIFILFFLSLYDDIVAGYVRIQYCYLFWASLYALCDEERRGKARQEEYDDEDDSNSTTSEQIHS